MNRFDEWKLLKTPHLTDHCHWQIDLQNSAPFTHFVLVFKYLL